MRKLNLQQCVFILRLSISLLIISLLMFIVIATRSKQVPATATGPAQDQVMINPVPVTDETPLKSFMLLPALPGQFMS